MFGSPDRETTPALNIVEGECACANRRRVACVDMSQLQDVVACVLMLMFWLQSNCSSDFVDSVGGTAGIVERSRRVKAKKLVVVGHDDSDQFYVSHEMNGRLIKVTIPKVAETMPASKNYSLQMIVTLCLDDTHVAAADPTMANPSWSPDLISPQPAACALAGGRTATVAPLAPFSYSVLEFSGCASADKATAAA